MKDAKRGAAVRMIENAYVRAAPSAGSVALGVAKRGGELPYAGRMTPEGWLMVRYFGVVGWVSSKFSFVVLDGDV